MKQQIQDFLKGLRCGLPVMLGYAPVSFAFAVSVVGIVGEGLPWYLVVLISITNFTSAGQAAGANLLIANAPLLEIGITVLIINIRYMLMSLSLSQKFTHMPQVKRLLVANGVTDEIFFLAMQQKGELSGWFFTGLSAGPYLGWILGTLGGALAGAVLPASLSSALGIALYAMFVAIVMPAARKSRSVRVVVLIAIGLACLFRYGPFIREIPSGWALILCAVAASAIGALRFPVSQVTEGEEAE